MHNEHSISDLYQSSVDAFPNTKKRQHIVDTVKMLKFEWTPYLGMKTLFLRGLAETSYNGVKHVYHPIILFKQVQFQESGAKIVAKDNAESYYFKPISYHNNDIVLRCECPDFFWRFNYYDHVEDSLYGRKRRIYDGFNGNHRINPLEMPGMCKHIMSMIEHLQRHGMVM